MRDHIETLLIIGTLAIVLWVATVAVDRQNEVIRLDRIRCENGTYSRCNPKCVPWLKYLQGKCRGE